MLRHGHHVARAGLGEQLRPGLGIELLRLEHRDELLVAELLLGAVGRDVVLIGLGALDVHVAGIPFVVEGGHAVHAPVNEDAQLQFVEPLRLGEFRQGLPAVAVGALGDDALDLFQVFLHFDVPPYVM